jgi:hypothetical protein
MDRVRIVFKKGPKKIYENVEIREDHENGWLYVERIVSDSDSDFFGNPETKKVASYRLENVVSWEVIEDLREVITTLVDDNGIEEVINTLWDA